MFAHTIPSKSDWLGLPIIAQRDAGGNKLHGKQSIKTNMKQASAEARIVALEAQLRIYSQPEQGDVKLEEFIPKQCGGESEGILQELARS